jgi:hypothetical protein
VADGLELLLILLVLIAREVVTVPEHQVLLVERPTAPGGRWPGTVADLVGADRQRGGADDVALQLQVAGGQELLLILLVLIAREVVPVKSPCSSRWPVARNCC